MDLTEAERLLRAHADDTVPVPVLYDSERAAVVLVLGELERLRAIEQRAREVSTGTVTNGAPWGQNAEIARYILGEPNSR